MKPLTEADVIRVMREEWEAKKRALAEKADVVMNSSINKEKGVPVLAPELKVMHRKSGIRYTIQSVGPRDVILRTPEGDTFIVDGPTLEQEYHLD